MYNSGRMVAEEAELESWFESLVCDIAARFTDLPPNQLDAGIQRAQRILCAKLGVEWSTLWVKSPERPDALILTHVYRQGEAGEAALTGGDPFSEVGDHARGGRAGLALKYGEVEAKFHFPWIFKHLERGETVAVESVDDLPPDAKRENQALLRYGMKSTVVVPLWLGRKWLGCLSFASMRSERRWPRDLLKRLELVGHLFSNAIARQMAENAVRENAASLRESESRFKNIADSAPVLIWMSDENHQCFFFNKPWLAFTGRKISEESGRGWIAGIHPDDLKASLQVHAEAFGTRQSFALQLRLRRHDGSYRWIASRGVPRYGKEGQFCGYIGSCVDISDQKEAEDAARDLAGRLINAQEQERARVARDLHDDVTQRLARLAIDAGRIENAHTLNSETEILITGLREGLARLSADVHAISHELHPSAVIDLGLVDALRAECEQISARHAMVAKVTFRNLPAAIPSDTAIGLFRIAQESLRNAVRHGRALKASVFLWGMHNGLQLVVEDDGIGFDLNQRKNRPSLGLASMQERTHLLGGTLIVESKPQQGTTIVAWVPLTESVL